MVSRIVKRTVLGTSLALLLTVGALGLRPAEAATVAYTKTFLIPGGHSVVCGYSAQHVQLWCVAQ